MPDSPVANLGPAQRIERDAAARALAASRVADLAALDAAGSIVMIESLRSSLDDVLRLLSKYAQ
ncbi:hypothetical protein ACFWTC_03330 [Streptomyces sp. NPDC058619]|uniref:hypothetical protein n=1 Tax=unclassified Streptomyces TaxID=2593676 RepID=UPI00365F605D